MATSQKLTEDFLTCRVCMGVFKSPCTLTCSHMFCRQCIIRCTKENKDSIITGHIQCPTCRACMKIEDQSKPVERWTDHIEASFVIQGLIDSFGPDSKDTDTCSYCRHRGEVTPSVFWCSVCDDSLCQKCVEIHRNVPATSHHIVDETTTGTKAPRKKRVPCKDHAGEFLEFICKDCDSLFCSKCFMVRHRYCKVIVEIATQVEKIKSELGDKRKKLDEQHARELEQTQKWKDAIIRTTENEKRLGSDIESTCDILIKTVVKRKPELLSELRTASQHQLGDLRSAIKIGEMKMQMLQQKIEILDETFESDSGVGLFKLHQSYEGETDMDDHQGTSRVKHGYVTWKRNAPLLDDIFNLMGEISIRWENPRQTKMSTPTRQPTAVSTTKRALETIQEIQLDMKTESDSQQNLKPTPPTEYCIQQSLPGKSMKETNQPKMITNHAGKSMNDTSKPDMITDRAGKSMDETRKPDMITDRVGKSMDETRKPDMITDRAGKPMSETSKPDMITDQTGKPVNETSKPDMITDRAANSMNDTSKPDMITDQAGKQMKETSKPDMITDQAGKQMKETSKPDMITDRAGTSAVTANYKQERQADISTVEKVERHRVTSNPKRQILSSKPILYSTIGVRTIGDSQDPLIFDILSLHFNDTTSVVVTDYDNYSLKSFRKGMSTKRLVMYGKPYGLTLLKENHVAVTVPKSKKIVVVEVNQDLKMMSSITTDKEYWGVTAVSSSLLALGCEYPPCVDLVDMRGNIVNTISPSINNMPLIEDPKYLCFTKEGNILVSNFSKSVVCVSTDGDVVFNYTGPGLQAGSAGIVCTASGDILVSDLRQHSIVRLTKTGHLVGQILAGGSPLLGLHVDYRGQLLVCVGGGDIRVYRNVTSEVGGRRRPLNHTIRPKKYQPLTRLKGQLGHSSLSMSQPDLRDMSSNQPNLGTMLLHRFDCMSQENLSSSSKTDLVD